MNLGFRVLLAWPTTIMLASRQDGRASCRAEVPKSLPAAHEVSARWKRAPGEVDSAGGCFPHGVKRCVLKRPVWYFV